MWTQFWDMHSGGGSKEKWARIYIEAPEEEAVLIFYNRFGHNPKRVSCTCCGDDYSISSHAELAQLTGYHRNLRCVETKRDPKTKLYLNDDPNVRYLEPGENPPKGYGISSFLPHGTPLSLDEYCKNPDVLVIPASEITEKERQGEVPQQGYVWID